jgi:ActR/RegA family two-component response regulator
MDKVLIAGADVDFAESLKSMLDSYNFRSILAYSEKKALESIRTGNVGLALLDTKLGKEKESGIRLLKRIVKEQPNTRCIMIAGFASEDTALQSIKLGASDFLVKPVRKEELLASIKKGQGLSGLSNKSSELGIEQFLNETAPGIERHFSNYTGSVTFHIRDGKLASWESKTGGRFKG